MFIPLGLRPREINHADYAALLIGDTMLKLGLIPSIECLSLQIIFNTIQINPQLSYLITILDWFAFVLVITN